MNRAFLAYADEETRAEWGHMDERYARYKKEFKGLGCRAFNCFYLHREVVVGKCDKYGYNVYKECDEYDTAEKVRAAIISGKLHPKRFPRPHNYGWRTHVEVCEYVGLMNPEKVKKAKRLKQLEGELRELKREMGV
jgi:hypothetical protein